MKKIALVFFALAMGCESKDQSVVPISTTATSPVTATQAVVPTAPTADSAKISVKTPDGKTTGFATMLAWELDLGASRAPQLAFFTEPATCDDRLDNSKTKFYAAFMGAFEPNDINELAEGDPYLAPNWGYTGLPDFVPGSEKDEGHPPAYWGSVTVTKADETTVEGTLDFESEGVVVRGDFVAQRCPDMQ